MKDWIMSLLGAAIFCSAALAVTPKGRVKSVLRLVCGAACTIALIPPVIHFDPGWLAASASSYRDEATALYESLGEENTRLSRIIIQDNLAAYILDKAQVLGVGVKSATVSVKWGDEGGWYPVEAHIHTNGTGSRDALTADIETALGIPPERQYWSVADDETR